MKNTDNIENVLSQATKVIVDEVSPDKIILFGSYARGDAGKYSDIDLMVLKKGVVNGHKIAGDIHLLFYKHRVAMPIDIVVMDYDKFYSMSENNASFCKEVKYEGKTIYGE